MENQNTELTTNIEAQELQLSVVKTNSHKKQFLLGFLFILLISISLILATLINNQYSLMIVSTSNEFETEEVIDDTSNDSEADTTLTPTVLDRNQVWYRNSANSKYQLIGECVMGGGYQGEYCALKDTDKNEVVYQIMLDGTNDIIGWSSQLVLGKENNDGVYLFSIGGDVGTAGTIYWFDSKTNVVSTVLEFEFDSVYYTDTFRNATKSSNECKNLSEFDPKCKIEAITKETASCLDYSQPEAYTINCISNINLLSDESVTDIEESFTTYKDTMLNTYKLFKEYSLSFYDLKGSYSLESQDTVECLDPKNTKAYTPACLIGLEDIAEEDKSLVQKKLENRIRDIELIGYPSIDL